MFRSVQQLRGIAVLAVVFFHASMSTGNFYLFSKANIGVQLFFMISGFIMAIIHGKDTGKVSSYSYFKKRAFRVYPLYLVIFFIIAPMFWITGKGGEHFYDITNIVRNIFIINEPSLRIHPYQWTLVFEMFYYLTFGVISIALGFGVIRYCFLMFTLYVITNFSGDNSTVTLFGNFNNLYFIIGCLIGNYSYKLQFNTNTFVTIITGIIFFSYPLLFENKFLLLALATMFFITSITSTISIPFIEKIGDASYSIYLSHAIVMTIGYVIIPTIYGVKFILLVMLSLLLGFTFYFQVEKKLTFLIKRRYYLNKVGT